ncbi:hypothetical protein MYA_3598 [Burkholderia sp. KJ006]|nr:hypothetical protein MYA_3598 [Burkholderia sp. KJ006]
MGARRGAIDARPADGQRYAPRPAQASPAKPSQAKPSQAKPSQAKPAKRAEPSRAEPSRAEPSKPRWHGRFVCAFGRDFDGR